MSFNAATLRKVAEAGIRRASTLASGANAQQAAGKIAAKLEPVIYTGKVVAEVGKQVYHAEKLAPPALATLAEAQTVATNLVQAVRSGAFKKWSNQDLVKGSILAGEALTFFLLGEIVGRRSLIGYDV
ncbi:hypothetical protein H9P43_005622 [Blastocladiella emersonii ATCC 22665]|nr:hypothetical protein H9P43_005622 [Blastocladiella emersonii ATCC 22665]